MVVKMKMMILVKMMVMTMNVEKVLLQNCSVWQPRPKDKLSLIRESRINTLVFRNTSDDDDDDDDNGDDLDLEGCCSSTCAGNQQKCFQINLFLKCNPSEREGEENETKKKVFQKMFLLLLLIHHPYEHDPDPQVPFDADQNRKSVGADWRIIAHTAAGSPSWQRTIVFCQPIDIHSILQATYSMYSIGSPNWQSTIVFCQPRDIHSIFQAKYSTVLDRRLPGQEVAPARRHNIRYMVMMITVMVILMIVVTVMVIMIMKLFSIA